MKSCPHCRRRYPDSETRCLVDDAPLEALADPRIGSLIAGRYHIEKPLGEGGMAVVYRARNALVDRPVAIKIMNPQLSRDPSLRERFRREAKNAASLAHPNIIEILDYGETEDGTPYLVMELLEGSTLQQMIAQGPIAIPRACALGVQIARGLARAHDFHVVHRDLKPENIFVSRAPRGEGSIAKILDFGIARCLHDSRLTKAGQIFGTPQYMAPEQFTSNDAGPSADLYAFGVILFEMVTGRPPFVAEDITGFLLQHLESPPPRPSELVPGIPRRLEELILRLLAKKPEERPVDAHQVEKELLALLPVDAVADLPSEQPSRQAPPAAPTLPPTTLERWARQIGTFEDMVRRAYPDGRPPAENTRLLEQLKEGLRQMEELRARGLSDQRKLEQMESVAREGRQRLGHAMHVLGNDLSQAREAARAARLEVQPYFEALAAAERAYREAHRKLGTLGGLAEVSAPTQPLARAHRDVADAIERWLLAAATAERAREWLESKEREVHDLEFQTDAIRTQLERLESIYEQERASAEEALRTVGRELDALDRRLTELAHRFLAPLRTRRELGDLIARLEQENAFPRERLN